MRVFSLFGLPGTERRESLGDWSDRTNSQISEDGRFDGRERTYRPEPRPRRRLGPDERGLASVEYVIILVAVTLGAALLVVAMGPALIRSFEWQVAVLSLPLP